jgi:hypothetical protein
MLSERANLSASDMDLTRKEKADLRSKMSSIDRRHIACFKSLEGA